MKQPGHHPIQIPPDVAAKCAGPDQFDKFDRLFRAVISHPKPPKAPTSKTRPKKTTK